MRKLDRILRNLLFAIVLTFMMSGVSIYAAESQGAVPVSEGLLIEAQLTDTQSFSTGAGLKLCREDGTKIGEYADWKSVVAQINSLNQKTTVYHVEIPGDVEIKGKLTMPGKGKYAGLVLAGTDYESPKITVSGSVTLTADLKIREGVSLSASSISGGSWQMTLAGSSSVSTKSGLTVGSLTLGRDTCVKVGGKLNVKKVLRSDAGAELVLTQKKMGSVKDTELLSETPLCIRIQDKTGATVTLTQGTTVLTVTGSSYAPQFTLLDTAGNSQAIYRKAKALKVQGALATPFALYDVTGSDVDDTDDGDDVDDTQDGEDSGTGDGTDESTSDGTDQGTGDGTDRMVQSLIRQSLSDGDVIAQPVYMGNFASLADIRTEINRRKQAGAVYEIVVEKAQNVKGTVAAPSAKAYGKLIYSGEKLSVKGSMKLAGYTAFRCESEISGSLSGGKGTVLELGKGVSQSVKGNLKAETLILRGNLNVGGTFTVTDITVGAKNELRYNISKKSTIKGAVTGRKLVLAPEKKGVLISTFTDGMRMMNSVPKADTTCFALYQDTTNIFYRDKNVLKLGLPRIRLFEGTVDYQVCEAADRKEASQQFATINDVIAYVNRSEQKDFVACMDEDVPSMGAMTALTQGKHLVLCGTGGVKKTLKFTGAITLKGCVMEMHNLVPDNKTSAGPKVNLSNGGEILLDNASVGAVTAKEGTTVTLAGESAVRGNLSGQGILVISNKAVARCLGNVAVKELVLKAENGTAERAEIRLLTQKKLTVSGVVTTEAGGCFVVNYVDKDDTVISVPKNTVILTAQYGDVSQFETENIIPGTFSKWALMKNGNTLRTTEPSESEGNWSGDYK